MTRVSLLLLAFSACAIDPEAPDEEPEITDIAARCPIYGCGVNTATGPDGQFFDELDWTGALANHDGVRIASFTLASKTLNMVVEGDRIVGVDSKGRRYLGDALEGANLKLETKTGTFRVEFSNVDTLGIQFWTVGPKEYVEVYDLKVYGPNGQWAWACNQPVNDWVGRSYSAIAFTGDRYDTKNKIVHDGRGTTWFQLACAGSYEAKLHLLRHTDAGGYIDSGLLSFPTTLADRTTYLKALTADFFGDGGTHTVTGTPLRYRDARGYHVDNTASARPEAYWDQYGAICLADPRIGRRDQVDPYWEIPICAYGLSRPAYVFTATPL